ncbi:MAG TPA: ABC transporter ATP-binding protein [Oceanithermus profundus]|uniref:ABC transporter ATP-binding protein n=1 Tax=Oceanithermus profundus TaxID=187137 RepID=A0A7C4ZH60_9DEIN|nr:ABC transporter ATP-binding protein [Oceanithermus profundus]
MTEPNALLTLKNVTKRFPGVVAVDRVSLEVYPGEVHALLGENGAGKTTLVSLLYGLYPPDEGEIFWRGRRVRIRSPQEAIRMGIGLVPQHPLLVRAHTVLENLALGMPRGFLFPTRGLEARIAELTHHYGFRFDPHAPVWQLSEGEKQRVEIVRALLQGARLLVLDEPTSVLTPQEARELFKVIRRMRSEGEAVIFISHKLDEVLEVADRISVLRKGRLVGQVTRAEADKAELARMMVGRQVSFERTKPPARPGEAVLELAGVHVTNDRGLPALRGVDLRVRAGEILGLAGVAGSGQRELVEVVTGLRRPERGEVRVLGRAPWSRRRARIAHIPEDRRRQGVAGGLDLAENLILHDYGRPPFARGPLLDRRAVYAFAREQIARYRIDPPDPRTPARLLSGGNLQKLILARELHGEPPLIVAVHPTYGLDVGATELVHELLIEQSRGGAAVLLVSEDLDEVLALADRVAVIQGGRIVGEVPAEAADRERIGLWMAGVGA